MSGERLTSLRASFDEAFWSNIPAIEGAVAATCDLADAGYELVCVSALEPVFEKARLRNHRALGFPIERVIATSRAIESAGNPKAPVLASLQPVAFVDDYLPFMQGLPGNIHTALLRSDMTGSPNHGPELRAVRTQHSDLAAFASWWLGQPS